MTTHACDGIDASTKTEHEGSWGGERGTSTAMHALRAGHRMAHKVSEYSKPCVCVPEGSTDMVQVRTFGTKWTTQYTGERRDALLLARRVKGQAQRAMGTESRGWATREAKLGTEMT